jgi:hypothetical protein
MYQFSKLSPNEFETLAVDIVGKMNNKIDFPFSSLCQQGRKRK